uniref:Uncharacterized protein n=1 Tax=Helianthus annuus TaxID=4232 RepID=A0A251V0R0_HELAN
MYTLSSSSSLSVSTSQKWLLARLVEREMMAPEVGTILLEDPHGTQDFRLARGASMANGSLWGLISKDTPRQLENL